jgi:hypothetical protein
MTWRVRLARWLLRGTDYSVTTAEAIDAIAQAAADHAEQCLWQQLTARAVPQTPARPRWMH